MKANSWFSPNVYTLFSLMSKLRNFSMTEPVLYSASNKATSDKQGCKCASCKVRPQIAQIARYIKVGGVITFSTQSHHPFHFWVLEHNDHTILIPPTWYCYLDNKEVHLVSKVVHLVSKEVHLVSKEVHLVSNEVHLVSK